MRQFYGRLGKNAFFLQEKKPMSIKFLVWGGGYFGFWGGGVFWVFWGGVNADFIFMGAWSFLTNIS